MTISPPVAEGGVGQWRSLSLPTLAELLVLGGDAQMNEGVVAESHSVNWTDPLHPLRMWVDKRWTYVESQDDCDELYDLRDDPLELRDQIANSDFGAQLERAQGALRRWCNATDDSWPHVV